MRKYYVPLGEQKGIISVDSVLRDDAYKQNVVTGYGRNNAQTDILFSLYRFESKYIIQMMDENKLIFANNHRKMCAF